VRSQRAGRSHAQEKEKEPEDEDQLLLCEEPNSRKAPEYEDEHLLVRSQRAERIHRRKRRSQKTRIIHFCQRGAREQEEATGGGEGARR